MNFRALPLLLIAIAFLSMTLWSAMPREVAILDGRLDLVLAYSDLEQPASKTWVAYCWNKTEADHARERGSSSGEIAFHPIETGPTETKSISLPYSATHRGGHEVSYHEPEYIVIEFNRGDAVRRKIFKIPSGRGERLISVDLD